VVTVHDLSFLGGDGYAPSPRLQRVVAWSVARARRVLVPTRAVAAEVVQRYRTPQDRVVVTPEGVDERFFEARRLDPSELAAMGINHPFCLALGTTHPRKNLARLLAAWRATGLQQRGWSLVVAGPAARLERIDLAAGVVAVGYVAEEMLPALFASADVFCYPSLYEGFGLPPLEAMAAATPVLAASYPAAREVLGEAALLVEPRDVEALAQGLLTLATDDALRQRLEAVGPPHARSFTWERTASATLAAYRAAVE
jgi:glycosyltransferase involved in cell wall biosynthesis